MADSLIHFADEATLAKALHDNGFGHFDRKIGLTGQLAGTSLDPVGLNMVIDLALRTTTRRSRTRQRAD